MRKIAGMGAGAYYEQVSATTTWAEVEFLDRAEDDATSLEPFVSGNILISNAAAAAAEISYDATIDPPGTKRVHGVIAASGSQEFKGRRAYKIWVRLTAGTGAVDVTVW